GRSLRAGAARQGGPAACPAGGAVYAGAAVVPGPDWLAAHDRGCRRIRARSEREAANGVAGARRSLAGITSVRGALGAAVARPGALRGLAWVPARRLPQFLGVPRLG